MEMNHLLTVSRVFSRYQETDSYCRRPGQGRPRVTSNCEESPKVVALSSRQINRYDSYHTIRIRLQERALRSRILARMSILTAVRHHAMLLIIESGRLNSGEMCCLQADLDFVSSGIWIWRRWRGCFGTNHVIQRRVFSGGSVMVWSGGISKNYRTGLTTDFTWFQCDDDESWFPLDAG